MSARPDVPRLSPEELDLLISRSLDGDLSPEEDETLARLVELDPAAARRKAELAALVADVKALPEPATPFALSTRVTASVSERGGRPGSLAGRVGFFPAPGFARAALVVLGIVGVAIAILRPAPRRSAEGPVDVVLLSPPPAAAPAQEETAGRKPASVVAEAREKDAPLRRSRDEEAPNATSRLQEREEAAKETKDTKQTADKKNDAPGSRAAGEPAVVADALQKSRDGRDQAAANAPAEAGRAEAAAKAKVASNERVDLDASRQAKAENAAGMVAPSAPAPAAAPEALKPQKSSLAAAAPHGWTVRIRGDAARRWVLRRAPDVVPPPHGTGSFVYRVALDGAGKVTSLARVGSGFDPRLDAYVKGMVFEAIPVPQPETRTAAKDVPSPAADFEIDLAPR